MKKEGKNKKMVKLLPLKVNQLMSKFRLRETCGRNIVKVTCLWLMRTAHSFIYIASSTYHSPLIFASCRDCPSYLASAETVRDLLLPAETTVHEKWLPIETVRVILLPAETLGRKLDHTDSLCRKLFPKHNSLDRKQEIADSLGGSQI